MTLDRPVYRVVLRSFANGGSSLTGLVLHTGANTPFTGFPYLASFVAEDRFLPRVLTRGGHRLASPTASSR